MRSKALAPGPRPPGTCRCRDVSVGEARTASRLGLSPQEPRATATCAASSVPGLVAGRCRGHAPRERPPGGPHSAKRALGASHVVRSTLGTEQRVGKAQFRGDPGPWRKKVAP